MRGQFPRNVLQGCLAAVDGKQNGTGMSRRLTEMTDWPERAAAAQWCVHTLAVACGVSLPQLERHCHSTWGQCPRAWLQAERMRRACELLKRRERIKDIAILLCYGHQRNFTTAFTKFHGYPPSQHWKKVEHGGLKLASPLWGEGGRRPDEVRPGRTERGQGEVSSLESEIGNRKSEIGNRKSEIGIAWPGRCDGKNKCDEKSDVFVFAESRWCTV